MVVGACVLEVNGRGGAVCVCASGVYVCVMCIAMSGKSFLTIYSWDSSFQPSIKAPQSAQRTNTLYTHILHMYRKAVVYAPGGMATLVQVLLPSGTLHIVQPDHSTHAQRTR